MTKILSMTLVLVVVKMIQYVINVCSIGGILTTKCASETRNIFFCHLQHVDCDTIDDNNKL